MLNDRSKSVKGSKVLIVGVAYKRDVSDMRESPAIDVIELLHKRGAHIDYVDPYVPEFREGTLVIHSLPVDLDASGYDIAVIVTDHTGFDYSRILKTVPVVFDSRAITRKLTDVPAGKVVRL